MDIKEEYILPDDVDSQNEADIFTMKRNRDHVAIKTDTLFIEHPVEQIKCEPVTNISNWEIDMKTETEQQTLGEFLPEDPVMKDKKYNSDIEIKEEPCWMEREPSTLCDDIKDGDFCPVEYSRFCMVEVSGDSDKSPLCSTDVSGRHTSFYNEEDHPECEHQKSDVTEMPTSEDHVLSEESGKITDQREMYLRALQLKHKSLIHNNQMPHQCNTCGRSFSGLSNLNVHHLIHQGMTQQCKGCNTSFTLLSHWKTRNLSKKPHQCKICDKRFAMLSHLKTHNLIHEGKKPYQCQTCNKGFTLMSHLKTHILMHEGKKPHQCKVCGKRFTHLSNLKSHNLIHEGKKPHQCTTCGKSFTQLSNWKRHNLVHEDKKPHQCKICYKTFIRLSQLKVHTLIHEDNKPYQCKACDMSFTFLSTLKRHNLVHEGKPHQCKTCGKRFNQLSSLKRHNLIHEGKMPYVCKTCGKGFFRFSHFNRHNLVHEGYQW